MTKDVVYATEPGLDPDEFIDAIARSGLKNRPVRDSHRIQRMIDGADIMLTARDGERTLVGIARSMTDHSFCCYLSDLAVDKAWQGRGIGRALIARTRTEAGPEAKLILLSAPGAMSYYAHIGMDKPDSAFVIYSER